jgi:hypothetical protein
VRPATLDSDRANPGYLALYGFSHLAGVDSRQRSPLSNIRSRNHQFLRRSVDTSSLNTSDIEDSREIDNDNQANDGSP